MTDATLQHYFSRYAASTEPMLPPAESACKVAVTIPSCREDHLQKTLCSLLNCDVPCKTEVLVLLNHSADAEESIKSFHQEQLKVLNAAPDLAGGMIQFHFMLKELPSRHAGVGLARKYLMDEALRRVSPDGIIVALDADCIVHPDYLKRIVDSFDNNPEWQGASVYFEHLINSSDPGDHAIASYELHLRYYVEAQRFIGLPYAYHTVGSCMAVRPITYARTGGMNRRKAGEDFYFLQKVIPHGFGEINETAVFPSGRESDRVPFGTGRAVMEFNSSKRKPLSYNPESILLVKEWTESCLVQNMAVAKKTAPRGLLEIVDFDSNMERIKKHSGSAKTYRKHFFQWFDGFLLMKVLHYLREHHFPDVNTDDAARWLLGKRHDIKPNSNTFDMLKQYRRIQRFNQVLSY